MKKALGSLLLIRVVAIFIPATRAMVASHIIKGVIVIEYGKFTGAAPGKVLRGP